MSEGTTLWIGRERAVDLVAIEPTQIRLEDIATSLERQCRFVGHCPWSVAAHSLLVAETVRRLGGLEPIYRTWALLHDAHEAFLGDIARPVLELLGPDTTARVDEAKQRIDASIAAACGIPTIPTVVLDVVYRADDLVLAAERAYWFADPQESEWSTWSYTSAVAFDDAYRAVKSNRDYLSRPGLWLSEVRASWLQMSQRGELGSFAAWSV